MIGLIASNDKQRSTNIPYRKNHSEDNFVSLGCVGAQTQSATHSREKRGKKSEEDTKTDNHKRDRCSPAGCYT